MGPAPILPLLMLAPGCTYDALVGVSCEPVVFNEIMTSNRNYVVDKNAGTVDWFELRNAGNQDADLSGYVLNGIAQDQAPCTIEDGTLLGPDEILAFYASTYALDVDAQVCDFDFNDLPELVELRSPEAAGWQVCASLVTPRTHADFSWQQDPWNPNQWCFASEPTPGNPNADCLCDDSDDC